MGHDIELRHSGRARIARRTACALVSLTLGAGTVACGDDDPDPGPVAEGTATPASSAEGDPDQPVEQIRVGWQTPWATQGQVVQSLKRTNVLDLVGLEATYAGFTFGGPLNEAAINDEVDVLFTADQPAAALLANGGDYTIVGRLMYNRVGIYVPPNSSIQEVADLAGARIGVPFGAAAQRDAIAAVESAGLDPDGDVDFVNLDILEHGAVVESGDDTQWEGFDALSGFDPTPALLEQQGKARMLHVGTVVSVVMMANDYIEEHPDAARRFLAAYQLAWLYYAQNQDEAGEWFKEESGLDFDLEVLDIAASVEPNVRATTFDDIRVVFTAEDAAVMQDAASFIFDQGLVPTEVTMAEHIDESLMESARELALDVGVDQVRPR